MENERKILVFLMNNRNKTFSINSIAKNLNMNYKLAYYSLQNLEKEKIISIADIGRAKVCSIGYQYAPIVVYAELERKKTALKNKDLLFISKRITEIKNPFFICILFGSYAKGEQHKDSDIDLCFILNEETIKKEIESLLRLIPLNIHPLFFTTDEFLSMHDTKKENVGKEISKDCIILKGIESYYEMMNHA